MAGDNNTQGKPARSSLNIKPSVAKKAPAKKAPTATTTTTKTTAPKRTTSTGRPAPQGPNLFGNIIKNGLGAGPTIAWNDWYKRQGINPAGMAEEWGAAIDLPALIQSGNLAPQYASAVEGRQQVAFNRADALARQAYHDQLAAEPGSFWKAGEAAKAVWNEKYSQVPDQLAATIEANAGSGYGYEEQAGPQQWTPEQLMSAYNSMFNFMKQYIGGGPEMKKALMMQVSVLPQYLQLKNQGEQQQEQWEPPEFQDPVQQAQLYRANALANAEANAMSSNAAQGNTDIDALVKAYAEKNKTE